MCIIVSYESKMGKYSGKGISFSSFFVFVCCNLQMVNYIKLYSIEIYRDFPSRVSTKFIIVPLWVIISFQPCLFSRCGVPTSFRFSSNSLTSQYFPISSISLFCASSILLNVLIGKKDHGVISILKDFVCS